MVHETSPLPLPSLGSLETFVRVVRLGSFRRVAQERGVAPSSISHGIRALEEAIGARLFHRTNRSIRLTEAGERLHATAGAALGDLALTIAEIGGKRDRPRGRLRLNVPRTVADGILRPMLGQFLLAYPDIQVEIICNDGLVDIVAEGFDAGIRPGRRLAPGMIAIPVGPARRFAVVAAPGYLARHGTPETPPDLHRHVCIERRYPGGGRYAWEFARNGEPTEIEVSGGLIVDDSALMLAAAREGAGLAFLHEHYVLADVTAGLLVRVLESWCPDLGRFHLYYPGRRQVPPPLRIFIDALQVFWRGQ